MLFTMSNLQPSHLTAQSIYKNIGSTYFSTLVNHTSTFTMNPLTGKPQEHVGQGEPSQAIESPTLTQQPPQPQAQQHPAHNQAVDDAPIPDDSFDDYHDPQEVIPTTSRPSDSSCVLAFATLDWEMVTNEPLYAHFHELFARQINPDTLELFDAQDAFHPFAFSAKLQSEDFPTYSDILCMEPIERAKWLQAMDQEINDLLDRNTFELVPRSEPNSKNEQVIKSMWAFRCKRKPNGEISRYKVRLVVRGDLQRALSNYLSNETFAPVVEWSTVRMLFTLGVIQDWKSASIDF
eukprot:scaffold12381_cov86-Amphora_coffeaeformis.AAC.2